MEEVMDMDTITKEQIFEAALQVIADDMEPRCADYPATDTCCSHGVSYALPCAGCKSEHAGRQLHAGRHHADKFMRQTLGTFQGGKHHK